MSVGTPVNGPMAATVMNLPLETSTGAPTSLAALRGKVIVLSDIMTLCQETCPLDTANLVQAARAVEAAGLGDKFAFVSATIDPERDTPVQLAAYQQLFSPPPADWTLLTGSPTNLAALWKYLGVYYQKVPEGTPPATDWRTGQTLTYDLDHADDVFFIDATGNERFVIDGPGNVTSGTQVPQALYKFMDDQGHQNLAHPDAAGSWTVSQALQVLQWLTGDTIRSATPGP